ncbi:MAG: GNAT family N-acetyltransferase [Bacteroidetes bacterium]|nr:GNAT family N-acetyltransferase [Bacteroidota bacterium]
MYQLQTNIQEILNNDPIQNMAVIGFFGNYKLDNFYQKDKSFLLLGSSDYTWAYCSVQNKEDLETLIENMDYETSYFANVEDWMLPILTKEKRIEWRLTTERLYIPEGKEVEPSEIECKHIDKALAGFIYSNSAYKDFTSVEYICDRLIKDISAGYFVDGELVGWALTHDDSSIGFLNIIQQYRGQGIGENILRYLTTERIKTNRPAFVNIESQNIQTKKMLAKIGYEFDRKVSWVKLV